uniref:Activin_recp domain-containing protein n=1 Tax=Steinernema glaseri TaxID=37863 RepID=A0A1I7ZE28_9BILA
MAGKGGKEFDWCEGRAAFLTLGCPASQNIALCYNQSSNEIISSPVEIRERTYGELLRNENIESFCCCSGRLCSEVNTEMKAYNAMPSHHHHHNHHHHHKDRTHFYPGGSTRSSSSLKPAVLTVLIAFMFR